MLFWFVGMSFLAVWVVFKDPAIDHRLVIAGALLPDLIDAPTGGAWVAHTLLASVTLLVGVMLFTMGRRLLRRRLLALPIGTMLHLVFDGAWGNDELFWWPFFGFGFGDVALPSIERGLVNLPMEVAGLAVMVWAWRRFRLHEPERRSYFTSTGRLGRDLMG